MKRAFLAFLQVVIVLIGIAVFAALLWEPNLEGRNVHATLFQTYFNDPFLAYVYVAFIPFFAALYQAIKLLGCVGANEAYSQSSMKALRTIKYCALITAGFIVGAEAYLFIVMRGSDDIAGGVAMGLFIIFVSVLIASAAAVFERTLRRGSGF